MKPVANDARMTLSMIATFSLVVLAALGIAQPAAACPDGDKADSCPFADEQIDVEADDLSDGARLTLRAESQEKVDAIHEWVSRFEEDGKPAEHLREKGADIEVETQSDGAQVTVRAEDPDLIDRLQRHFAHKAEGKGCGGHKKHEHHAEGHDCHGKKEGGECQHAGHEGKKCDHDKKADCDCKHSGKTDE